jgi:hypothetical protein
MMAFEYAPFLAKAADIGKFCIHYLKIVAI